MNILWAFVYNIGLSLILFTAILMWWQAIKHGWRSASKASIIAIPIAALCAWLLFRDNFQTDQEAASASVRSMVSDMRDTLFPSNAPDLNKRNREDRLRSYVTSSSNGEGRVAEREQALKEFIGEGLRLREELQEISRRIRWDYILDPTRLASDAQMAQSTVMVDIMTSATESYVSDMRYLYRNPPPSLRGALTQDTKDLMFVALTLQHRKIEQVGEVISFLTAINGKWKVGERQILFVEQSDADQYNQYLHDIFRTVSELQSVEEKRLSLAKKSFEQLQTLQQ